MERERAAERAKVSVTHQEKTLVQTLLVLLRMKIQEKNKNA